MAAGSDFFDTNVVLYLLSDDNAKADQAEALLAEEGTVSVQVLNEFVAVATRKLRMPWTEIHDVLEQVRAVCTVVPLTIETHERAVKVAERHGLSVYDALIVSAALLAGCKTLFSEDMQDGQLIERQLRIRNPFAACGEVITVGCRRLQPTLSADADLPRAVAGHVVQARQALRGRCRHVLDASSRASHLPPP